MIWQTTPSVIIQSDCLTTSVARWKHFSASCCCEGQQLTCHCPVESHDALRECLPKLLPKPENCRHCIIHTAAAIVYQNAVTSCVCHHLAQLGATVSSSSRDAVWFSCIMTWWKLPRRVTCYGAVVWFQLDRRALLLSEPQASFIFFPADKVAIIQRVKPPTHGWMSLEEFMDDSVQFKLNSSNKSSISYLHLMLQEFIAQRSY